MTVRIYGVDFTCAPRRAKPITIAVGALHKTTLWVEAIERLESFAAFESFLASAGPWTGGFDFPFSLPRELVRDLRWPTGWRKLVEHCSAMDRLQFRAALDAYRNSRAPGKKYAHRATDLPAGSSSPMKLVNPPVALMFHEGARRLVEAGVNIPFLRKNNSSRIALEAYPGLLVRKQLGFRESYKSDTRRDQTAPRQAVRARVIAALQAGEPLQIKLRTEPSLRKELVADGSGDLLDAVICAVQAAWAFRRPNFGIPAGAPRGEGWIISS